MMKSFAIIQVALIDTNTVPYSYNFVIQRVQKLGTLANITTINVSNLWRWINIQWALRCRKHPSCIMDHSQWLIWWSDRWQAEQIRACLAELPARSHGALPNTATLYCSLGESLPLLLVLCTAGGEQKKPAPHTPVLLCLPHPPLVASRVASLASGNASPPLLLARHRRFPILAETKPALTETEATTACTPLSLPGWERELLWELRQTTPLWIWSTGEQEQWGAGAGGGGSGSGLGALPN